jgi:hypothetical protein
MIVDAALELADARFKEISSSKEIIVNVCTYNKYKDLDQDLLKNPSDDLLQNAPLPRMDHQDYGSRYRGGGIRE